MTLHLKLKLNRMHFSLSLNNQEAGPRGYSAGKGHSHEAACLLLQSVLSHWVERFSEAVLPTLETKHLGLKGLEMVGEEKRKLCLESFSQLSIDSILDCIIEFFNLV